MIVLSKKEEKRVFGIVGRNINILRRDLEILLRFVAEHCTGIKAVNVSGVSIIRVELNRLSEKMDDSEKNKNLNFELYQELKGEFTTLYDSFLDLISAEELKEDFKEFMDECFEECEEFEEFSEPV